MTARAHRRRARIPRVLAALTLSALVVGCGDGVVGDGYRGVPAYTFSGKVDTTAPGALLDRDLQVEVFWSLSREFGLESNTLVRHPRQSADVRFPGVFEINLFGLPPVGAPVDGPNPHLAIGVILAFVDDEPHPDFLLMDLRGGAANQLVLYAAEPIPAAASPTRTALPQGYSVARLPLPCYEDVVPEPDRCGVPLGAPCTTYDDCGVGGICYEGEYELPFPGGMCVQSADGDCRPSDGVLTVPDPDSPFYRFWMPGCSSSAACRTADGFTCGPWPFTVEVEETVCIPGEPLTLTIGPYFSMRPLCEGDPDPPIPGRDPFSPLAIRTPQ